MKVTMIIEVAGACRKQNKIYRYTVRGLMIKV